MSTTASDDEFIQDDSDFRQHILQKLADFGDSLLDEDDFAERKRKATKRKSASQKLSNKCNSSITSDGNGTVSDSKHHKLKKKRKKLSVTAEANIQFNGKRNSLHGEQKHLQQLRTELGLTSSGTERLEKGTQHKQPKTHSTPRYAKLDQKQIDESNIIVFQEPGRSKKTVPLEIQKKNMSEATKKVEEQSEGEPWSARNELETCQV
ncbi:hypothetical protein LSAT2_009677 [Lamellibrachia satsuma]|nr:hypothetical protein LSAT2_009677 [Lamellibrachia satsuma]